MITFADHLIDIGHNDITPEQEREIEAREECARRGIDPDELCADGGVEAWMVVGQELAQRPLRLSKRPVAFRVRKNRTADAFDLTTDEAVALAWSESRGVDYEGLYRVGDRRAVAKLELWERHMPDPTITIPADQLDLLRQAAEVVVEHWPEPAQSKLQDAIAAAREALAAAGVEMD